MSRILIVEDEVKIARFVELELKHEGYDIEKAFDGRTGLDMALSQDFDLILLDVMLPQLNGLEVLRRIRLSKDTPVILLTARDAVMDKVSGLDAGADDYITKPFAIEELLARIRVALKKRGTPGAVSAQPALEFGELSLDTDRHEVIVRGESVELTNREFELLKVLLLNKNIVMERSRLIEEVCGYDYLGETNVIDVYVRYLRTKIDDRFGIHVISTHVFRLLPLISSKREQIDDKKSKSENVLNSAQHKLQLLEKEAGALYSARYPDCPAHPCLFCILQHAADPGRALHDRDHY